MRERKDAVVVVIGDSLGLNGRGRWRRKGVLGYAGGGREEEQATTGAAVMWRLRARERCGRSSAPSHFYPACRTSSLSFFRLLDFERSEEDIDSLHKPIQPFKPQSPASSLWDELDALGKSRSPL